MKSLTTFLNENFEGYLNESDKIKELEKKIDKVEDKADDAQDKADDAQDKADDAQDKADDAEDKAGKADETIKNEKDFRAAAKAKFEEVFGDELDEKRMKETVDGLLKDNKKLVDANKWGELIGMLNQSFA